VGGHLDRGHVLPVFRFGEEPPPLARIVCGLLTAERTQCAVASNLLQPHLPVVLFHKLIPPLAAESFQYIKARLSWLFPTFYLTNEGHALKEQYQRKQDRNGKGSALEGDIEVSVTL
jgi:hypothetical protein